MRPCRSTALDPPLLWPCTLSLCAPKNTRAPFQRAPAPCTRCDAIVRLRHCSRIRTCRLRPFTALVPVHCSRPRALRSCPCSAHVPVHCARARTASHVCERAARAVQCACARVPSILCASRPPVPIGSHTCIALVHVLCARPVHSARARTASHVCERAAKAVQCACVRLPSNLCESRPAAPKAATQQRGLRLCNALAAHAVLTAVPRLFP
jgi:hypothetical protein